MNATRITRSQANSRSGRTAVVAVAVLVAAIAVLGASCTQDDGGGASTAHDGSGAGQVVRLVTYDAFALPEDAAKEFERQTGAKIEVVASGDSGGMLTKALLSAGAPEGDVIFGIDNTLATRVTDADLLERFTPTAQQPDPSLKLAGTLGSLLTPIDRGDVCINVDSALYAEHAQTPPSTLEDLAAPAYKDQLVVTSPVTSSPGLAFLIGTVDEYGDKWPDYWQRLKANGVRVRSSWDDAWNTDYTVSGGDRPLVVSYASSPPAEVVYGEGKVTEPRSTIMADSCVQQVEYAGLLSGAEQPSLGRKLIEFMLSPTWQKSLPLTNFVFPAVQGTELPDAFQRWAVLPKSSRTMSAEAIGEHRDQWIEQWRSIME